MSIFATATPAPEPKTKDAQKISIFHAGILVIFALAQLYSFESFLELFADFGFPGGRGAGYLLAAVLVTLEVFAIPFLLRMRISPAFRWFSGFAGLIVSVIWLFVSSWVVGKDLPVNTVGFLGTVIEMMPGWWAILISFALLLLSIWSLWGLWPGTKKKTKKRRR